jgi:hypothetical protein
MRFLTWRALSISPWLAAGDAQAAEGNQEDALKLYERALDVNRRLFGESSEEVATAAACVEVSAAASAARARGPAQRLRLWRRAAQAAELAYGASGRGFHSSTFQLNLCRFCH